MKIYINETHEIKAINESADETLTMYEIDRVQVFGNMSDYMILNYCYKVDEFGYSIYPDSDYSKLLEQDYRNKVDEQQNKISILEEENETLKIELSITQDAVNELLFNTLNA